MTDNELTVDQYDLLFEAYTALKLAGNNDLKFKNKNLELALEGREQHYIRYIENHYGAYDPLKSRVAAGIAQSLAKANVEIIHSR